MSLTSYRAAPSRDIMLCYFQIVGLSTGLCRFAYSAYSCAIFEFAGYDIVREIKWLFIRFGGDLLSHDLSRSTIGATVLNGRVRDGIGCFTSAVTTKPNKEPRGRGYFLSLMCPSQIQLLLCWYVCFCLSQ